MSSRLMLRMRRAGTQPGDAGMSLVEVLVASTLSIILGAMTIAIFLNVNTTASATTDRSISTADARVTVQSWAAYLRAADGTTPGSRVNRIEWLTDHDALFYADLNNRSMSVPGTTSAPTMIWLRRDTRNALVEEQFASTAAAGAKPIRCRVLVWNVIDSLDDNGNTTPLFSAFDYGEHPLSDLNPPLDMGSAPTPSAGCQNLPVTVNSRLQHPDTSAQANLQNVFSVHIDFTVRDTKNQHPIAFSSVAFLPSLGGV